MKQNLEQPDNYLKIFLYDFSYRFLYGFSSGCRGLDHWNGLKSPFQPPHILIAVRSTTAVPIDRCASSVCRCLMNGWASLPYRFGRIARDILKKSLCLPFGIDLLPAWNLPDGIGDVLITAQVCHAHDVPVEYTVQGWPLLPDVLHRLINRLLSQAWAALHIPLFVPDGCAAVANPATNLRLNPVQNKPFSLDYGTWVSQ